jgi:hypothetical protein
LYCKLVLLFFLGSLFPCTLQGRLFPLLVHVMFCWFPACIASLSCSFLIYTFLTFDQKKKKKELSVDLQANLRSSVNVTLPNGNTHI